jgi:hypothetical protein
MNTSEVAFDSCKILVCYLGSVCKQYVGDWSRIKELSESRTSKESLTISCATNSGIECILRC